MRAKSSKFALGFASLATAALVLSGCSSSDDDVTATDTTSSESTTESTSVVEDVDGKLSDGTPFSGERITLADGNIAGAPVITLSLPATWTHAATVPAGIVDLLQSSTTEPSGFSPNTTVAIDEAGNAPLDDALAAGRAGVSALNAWNEVKYSDIDVDGHKAFRLAGTWVAPNVDVPVYAVMTVVAYQADANSPVYVISFVNQFTDIDNLETSNEVEEINTSIEFG
ncbi:hypothetical protein ABH922_000176 [Rhodococcus sp. 27YEA15]|uniref:LpqN/LpqT family lipoprotein n=1 Tax=Rhodococcus sp. 27YEA15 TaxID=3156259 RepID=UPI003C7EA60F